MKKELPRLRIFVEGVVIVCSILLAFAIDAFWDERGDRIEEVEAIAGLRADFASYRRGLESQREAIEREVSHSEYLLSWPGGSAELDVAKADSAFRWIINAATWETGNRTLESLVASGQLRLIQNDDLRGLLRTWASALRELQDDELVVRDFVRNTLVPYLAEAGVPIVRVYHAVYPERPAGLQSDGTTEEIYRGVLAATEFRSLLAYRHNWALGAREESALVRDLVERILALLEEEANGE